MNKTYYVIINLRIFFKILEKMSRITNSTETFFQSFQEKNPEILYNDTYFYQIT